MPLIGPLDLGPLTTLGLPARAADAWRLDAIDELPALRRHLDDRPGRPLLLGGGSNLLLARDLDEPVVLMRTRGRRVVADDGQRAIVEIAAGENWDRTVRWTLDLGLAGLENLILIPGTTGAAPWQNIGAYGVELAGAIESVDAWHRRDDRIETFDRAACRFGYRDSVFKQPGMEDWLILTVRLTLGRDAAVRTDYGEIRAELGTGAGGHGSTGKTGANGGSLGAGAASPSPRDVATAVERIRRRKLPDPAEIGNVGSFFKNPVIDAAQAAALATTAAAGGLPPPPVYPTGDQVKVSAAWLIERCGWKGYRDGDAGVSPRHALVLVNHGRATGAGMLALARRIQASVFERFGIRLEPEPRIIA